jgi:uncharacterized RDD family membrane protein YckC
MKYAGFWVRFLAMMMDSMIFSPFAILIYLKLGFDAAIFNVGSQGVSLVIFLASFILPWLYFALFESGTWQATPGKRIMGIYVTNLNAERISFGRASARYFGKVISSITFLVGYVMAGFTENKQSLHDKLADTLVLFGKPGRYNSPDVIDQREPSSDKSSENSSSPNWVFAGFDASGNLVRVTFKDSDSKLTSKGLIVGRSSDTSDLYISDASVSRQHARFYKVGDKLFLEDLNSTNGTKLNGKNLSKGSKGEIKESGELIIGGVELSIGKY